MQIGTWISHFRSRPSPRESILFTFVVLFVVSFLHPRSRDAFSSSPRRPSHQFQEESDEHSLPSLTGEPTHWCDGDSGSIWPGCDEGKTQRFAYVQYATTVEYLCNSLIAFTRLRRFNTRAELAFLHPLEWNDFDESHAVSKLLRKIDALDVNFHPIEILSRDVGEKTWSQSFTKLMALGLTEYDRVIHFDSDGLIFKNLDHLFFSPQASIALPRAYWLNDVPGQANSAPEVLASHIMVLTPSQHMYERVVDMVKGENQVEGFDMELMNRLGKGSALILPHRHYAMLSGEFRRDDDDHARYLGEDPSLTWDPDAEAESSFYVHFSDWPLPKPWIRSDADFKTARPRCSIDPASFVAQDCRNRKHWVALYEEYWREKAETCDA
ncbi:nucleotide-diphospho-sugar transferase [Mrakia frigida]|uniref:nucleotide-diphospho-sugar transferase n=1 Tax=Mrakia frigida TaxID=29902 RepID=UPI003FCC08A2